MPLDGQTLGHYRLQRLIGRGGMGEVYIAEDTRIGRQVAVKVVLTEPSAYPDEQATKDTARLFQREMKAIAALDHPHVLPLYDFGETTIDKLLIAYLVMPYRPEGSLSDWLQQRGPSNRPSPEDVGYFIAQAADALQHAHEHHLIHQDVKPSNFLIRNRPVTPRRPDIFLVDFGVAKFTTATASASQSVRGTPAYMAPEQWDGQPVAATDQYALAVMAYQLLTGRPPFTGRMEQVMRQHFNATPQPPGTFNSNIPPALDTVILLALEKKPENRFAAITAFANAFEYAVKPSTSKELAPIVYQSEPEQKPLAPTVPVSQPTPVEQTIPASKSDELIILDAIDTLPSPPPEVEKREVPVPPPLPRPRSIVRTLFIVGLALVVITSSIVGFSIYQGNVNQQHANATVSANDATSQADKADATAMASVKVTNSYPSYMPGQGTLALYDPLNHQGNWSSKSNTKVGGSCQFSNVSFVINLSQSNSLFACEENQAFSNFAFEVHMTIIQGDCGGIVFRYNNLKSQFYYFDVCQYGDYQLRSYVNSSTSPYITGGFSPVSNIRTGLGQSNTIAVVANGASFILYANGKEIGSAQDISYSTGQLALSAEDDSNSTKVAFSMHMSGYCNKL